MFFFFFQQGNKRKLCDKIRWEDFNSFAWFHPYWTTNKLQQVTVLNKCAQDLAIADNSMDDKKYKLMKDRIARGVVPCVYTGASAVSQSTCYFLHSILYTSSTHTSFGTNHKSSMMLLLQEFQLSTPELHKPCTLAFLNTYNHVNKDFH